MVKNHKNYNSAGGVGHSELDMIFSLEWMKDYINYKDISKSTFCYWKVQAFYVHQPAMAYQVTVILGASSPIKAG